MPVVGLSNVAAIAAAAYHSLALQSNGAVWAWGWNTTGENGSVATFSNTVPVRLDRFSDGLAIASGGGYFDYSDDGAHSLILKNDGTVWGCGNNYYGEVGDDTTQNRFVPVAVEGLTILPPGVPNPLARHTRFIRGYGYDETYLSFVIPLDGQKGVKLYPQGGNTDVLFQTNLWTDVLEHYNNHYHDEPIAFTSPIAGFGSRVGGTALYCGQQYNFGVYAGDPEPHTTNAIAIAVYDKNTWGLTNTIYLPIPRPNQSNEWATFLLNGYTTSTNAYGLTTTLSFSFPEALWGPTNAGCFRLTHSATPTNYLVNRQPIAGFWPTFRLVAPAAASWSSRPCNAAGAPSLVFVRTFQHTGHPHPVLVLVNLGNASLITEGFLPTELETRLLPALWNHFLMLR